MVELDVVTFIFASGPLIFVRTTAPNGWHCAFTLTPSRHSAQVPEGLVPNISKFERLYLRQRVYTGTNHTSSNEANQSVLVFHKAHNGQLSTFVPLRPLIGI